MVKRFFFTTSMFADRYFGFLPLHEEANKVLQRWRVLAFFRVALSLNAAVVLVSAWVCEPKPAFKLVLPV